MITEDVILELRNRRVASQNARNERLGRQKRGQMPMPPYRGQGVCRLCAEPILRPDGKPNLRRLWHQVCADRYLAANDSAWLRRTVWTRDHGKCARCPAVMGRHGNWHADHVVALVNGGSTDLVNVQTLCVACHKLKTREDLAERDRRRHERAMADLVRLRVMPLDEAFGLPVGGALR